MLISEAVEILEGNPEDLRGRNGEIIGIEILNRGVRLVAFISETETITWEKNVEIHPPTKNCEYTAKSVDKIFECMGELFILIFDGIECLTTITAKSIKRYPKVDKLILNETYTKGCVNKLTDIIKPSKVITNATFFGNETRVLYPVNFLAPPPSSQPPITLLRLN